LKTEKRLKSPLKMEQNTEHGRKTGKVEKNPVKTVKILYGYIE
jgi:hypothetical protein